MATPLLLASPGETRDRSGTVTPTVNGAVTLVAGQYGQAWQMDTSGEYVSVPSAGHLGATVGTVLARGVIRTPTVATNQYLVLCPGSSPNQLLLGRHNSGLAFAVLGSGSRGLGAITHDVPVFLGLRYDGTAATLFLNTTSSAFTWSGTATGGATLYLGGQSADYDVTVESVLTYDTALSDAEIAAIRTMPEAWSWDALVPASTRTLHPVLKIGSSHIGPLRVGERT